MRVEDLEIEGVKLITPKRFGDGRGWFSETFNAQALAGAGVDIAFVQDNQSFSAEAGTVRGLHAQAPPMAQDKLVRVLTGAIFDVAVDIRKSSPTYGHWCGAELSAETGAQLLVPKGFLHGFVTLVPNCTVFYKCSAFYAPETECAVRVDDADLGIEWGIDVQTAIMSDKDRAAPGFAALDSPFEAQP